MDGRKIVGWNVRKLRVALGFSIEELADRAGLGDSFVSKLERGEVNASVDNLELLAKPLRAELADLFEKPKPGERPPAPLRAGRRPQRLPKVVASQSEEELLRALARRAIVATRELSKSTETEEEIAPKLSRRTRTAVQALSQSIDLFVKKSGSRDKAVLRLQGMNLGAAETRMVHLALGVSGQPVVTLEAEAPGDRLRLAHVARKLLDRELARQVRLSLPSPDLRKVELAGFLYNVVVYIENFESQTWRRITAEIIRQKLVEKTSLRPLTFRVLAKLAEPTLAEVVEFPKNSRTAPTKRVRIAARSSGKRKL